MTYLAQERSEEDGQPIELYRIDVQNEDPVFFNSSALPYTLPPGPFPGGNFAIIHPPESVSRSELKIAANMSPVEMQIAVPTQSDAAELLMRVPDDVRAMLTISRVHNTDGDNEAVIIYRGVLTSLSRTRGGDETQAQFLNTLATSSKNFPRFTYSAICGHYLYDQRCQVNRFGAPYEYIGTISQFVNITRNIEIPGVDAFAREAAEPFQDALDEGAVELADTWFQGGFVEAGIERRMIRARQGDILTLESAFSEDVIGVPASVFAGCNHSVFICISKFNNLENFGGTPTVPTINPYVTSIRR